MSITTPVIAPSKKYWMPKNVVASICIIIICLCLFIWNENTENNMAIKPTIWVSSSIHSIFINSSFRKCLISVKAWVESRIRRHLPLSFHSIYLRYGLSNSRSAFATASSSDIPAKLCAPRKRPPITTLLCPASTQGSPRSPPSHRGKSHQNLPCTTGLRCHVPNRRRSGTYAPSRPGRPSTYG